MTRRNEQPPLAPIGAHEILGGLVLLLVWAAAAWAILEWLRR